MAVTLRTCRLTPVKTLESFDFSFQPSLDRERVMALASLGIAAARAGRSVCRIPLAER